MFAMEIITVLYMVLLAAGYRKIAVHEDRFVAQILFIGWGVCMSVWLAGQVIANV